MKLEHDDAAAIATIVTNTLRRLLPADDQGAVDALLLGNEFFADPKRVSTPKTDYDFSDNIQSNPIQKLSINAMRKQLVEEYKQKIKQAKDDGLPNLLNDLKKEYNEKRQQLNSIILLGQLLFSQSACLHFIDKLPLNSVVGLNEKIETLRDLANKLTIDINPLTRTQLLADRKEFTDLVESIRDAISSSSMKNTDQERAVDSINKAEGFYRQVNDLNFEYANTPSHSYSNFLANTEDKFNTICLVSSLIGIAAIALSFIPVLTPIMAPIAAVSGLISLGLGLPVSLKTLGTLMHNFFKYGVAPSKSEVIESAFIGSAVLLTGIGRVAAKSSELALQAAGKLGKSANNLTCLALDIADFISGDQVENNKKFITDYRKQLNEIKKDPNVEVDEKEQNDGFKP